MSQKALVAEGNESVVVVVADCKHCGKTNEWRFENSESKLKSSNVVRSLPTMVRGTEAAAEYVSKALSRLGYKASFNKGDLAVFTRHGWITPDEKGDNGLSIFRQSKLDNLAERIAKSHAKDSN